MMRCPVCELNWWACSCSNYRIRKDAEERDWGRDYGFNDDYHNEAEQYIQERNRFLGRR